MSTDNTATTWRDLADQLTPKQRTTLERFEQDERMPADMLLDFARDHIEARLVDIAYADVPIPPSAKVGAWEQNTAGSWSRSLVWADLGNVDISGRQEHDGTYTRHIGVYVTEGAELDAATARRLAAELLNAADILDQHTA